MSNLSATARVILGLLAFRPRTGYEIKQVTDSSTKFFWSASYGQIYPELRRLESAGLVRASDEPRGRVRRRVYALTPRGRRTLAEWLRDDLDIFEFRDEGLLRLFFGELVPTSDLRRLAERRAAWFEDVRRLFAHIGVELGPLEGPDGEVLRYGIELMEWNAAWWRGLGTRLEEGRLAGQEG
jgi:DNA-binding PadR family transcriptional regulator